jgi:hypothetical protein
MQRLPLQSDHQRLRVACSDVPPGKRCRLGPPNPHPKIMKFSNQLGDFRNALKQSLFTTAITHKRHLTKPEVQFSAKTCTRNLNFPTPEEYGSTKGRTRQAAATAAKAGSGRARCGAQNQIIGAQSQASITRQRVICAPRAPRCHDPTILRTVPIS